MAGSRSRVRRAAVAAVALCAGAAAPAAAQAASLVYIDQGGDVAVARPDGSLARKVTHASDLGHGYKAPSVADDGGITAYLRQSDDNGNASFVVLGQDGTVRSGPFLFEKVGLCGGIGPFWTATSPDGAFVAVHYWKGSDNCLGGSYTPSTRLTNRTSPTFGTSTYPSYDYLTQPRWIRHPDQRLAGIVGDTLQVWQNDAAHMQDWITVTGGLELDGFDVHPTATKLLLDVAESGVSGSKPHTLALLTYTELSSGAAPPSDPAPTLVCSAEAYVTNDLGGGHPVWSPDGSQIAWIGSAGIYVSPAPSRRAAAPARCRPRSSCRVGARSAGRRSTSPRRRPAAAPRPRRRPAATTTPTPPAGTRARTPAAAPAKPAAAFSAVKATAAKRAFTLRLTLRKAATVRIVVARRGARRALGTLTFKARRKGAFTRRIAVVGGRRLRPGSYTVAITVGPTRKTLTVRVLR